MHEVALVWNEIRKGNQLVIEALDSDIGGTSDHLGASNPLSYNVITQDTELIQHNLELYDKNYKHVGEVSIQTQFIWRDADPIPKHLNVNSKIKLVIEEVSFLTDADFIGNQDPFIVFNYGKTEMQTSVKEDAGLHAVFNESFILESI